MGLIYNNLKIFFQIIVHIPDRVHMIIRVTSKTDYHIVHVFAVGTWKMSDDFSK